MNLAVDYIEENLNSVITLEDVAKIACCSKYHFHRVFFSCFNVTFAEYVRRRRLTLAAADLVSEKGRVVDIALEYGYGSPNAFTRAFRNVHGINPSDVLSSRAKLTAYNRVFFPLEKTGVEKMDYKIVKRPSFKVIGKSKNFTFDDFVKNGSRYWKGYVTSDSYKKLYQLTNGKPGPLTGAPLLSVYLPKENSKKDEMTDVLGLEVPSDMDTGKHKVHTVPAATYAEFDCTYKTAMKTNRYIYREWFSSVGYERDGNKPDIAAYFPIAFRPMGEMGVRWWIPVVKKK
ncbi:AraC family transcriptional regulator [Exilibacterium tricleocarpae]|nr:AraC family transcriptional regulator [Exilibacterium tricleocarpae]